MRQPERPAQPPSSSRVARIRGSAVLAVVALAAASAGAGALWARQHDGPSSPARSAQPATPAEPDRSLPSSTRERHPVTTTAPTRGVAGANYTKVSRPEAFNVPGAPREPLDEIALPVRARRLDAWLTAGRRPTAANQRHWLYQHAWIVTGANFGWWHGAEALRLLIRVDRRVESRWGIGYRSEAVARRALGAVEARTK